MNPFLLNKNLDLVDFGDIKMFMFRDDNLYNIAVSDNRKNQSLAAFQNGVRENGFTRSAVNPENIAEVAASKYGVYLFLSHLWSHGIDFTVLDIGSHVGDFSLKVGSFIRTFQKSNRVISFDPTEAGALVEYNIELNGLGSIVHHENLAVADFDGLMVFSYRPGFSDSSKNAEQNVTQAASNETSLQRFLKKPLREKVSTLKRRVMGSSGVYAEPEPVSYDFIAKTVDIVHYLENNGYPNDLFVKIDIEGSDNIVINRLMDLRPNRLVSMIFEFTPSAFDSVDVAAKYLRKLANDFYLFDLYYSPNPTRFRLMDGDLLSFSNDVSQRKYHYTDIFALDRRTPDCEKLIKRLSGLAESNDEIVL